MDLALVQKSEKRTFIVDKNKYQNPVRVHFENSLGGFDAYTLTGDYMKGSKVSRSDFEKGLGLGFAIRDRGAKDLAVNPSVQHEVYSSLLSNAEAEWLFELSISTDAYIKNIGDSYFTPINILSESQVMADSKTPPQLKLVYSESNKQLGLNN